MPTVGNFEWDVNRGPYPVYCGIAHKGTEIRFTHADIADLEHVVRQMKRAAQAALPEVAKDELP